MSIADISGDTTLHDHPAALDYGPVIGTGMVLFAWFANWISNWSMTLKDADELVQFLTHSCFSVMAMVGAYKALSPAATKAWQFIRRRTA